MSLDDVTTKPLQNLRDAAVRMLKMTRRHETDRPVAGHIVIYSKPGCSLCELALALASAEFGRAAIDVVNINDHCDRDEFALRIPVLTYRGRVLAEGRISRADLSRAKATARRLDALDAPP